MTNTAKPKQKPAPKPAIDWQRARTDFVFGTFDERGSHVFPDLKQVAAAHGLSYQTVRAIASRGNRSVPGHWSEDRLRSQQRLAEVIETKRATATANAIVELEGRHLRTWAAMEACCTKKLYAVRDGTVAGFNSNLSAADVRAYAETLKMATTMQRELMGIPEGPIVVREKDTEPAVLKLLTMEDFAEAGNQLAMAMTNKRRALQALPSDIEVGEAKDDPHGFARGISVDRQKRRIPR